MGITSVVYLQKIIQKDIIFIEKSFQPPFIVPNQEILSLVDYKEKIVIYTKI